MAVSGTSSSISSALGVTGKGIGGLATGLNTDELVEALTSGTRLKISKQGQQKQLLNWKMTAYRSMATALSAFQTKFLKTGSSSASNTNITQSKFFNTYKATSSSDKVSVSTTSGAVTGNFTIDKVKQLATAESYTGTNKMSTTLNLDIKSEDIKEGMFTGKTLSLEVDGFETKTIKLDDLNKYVIKTGTPTTTTVTDEDGLETEVTTDGPPYTFSLSDDFRAGLQTLLNKEYRSEGLIKVGGENGSFTLDSSSAQITVNASNSLFGVDAGDSNRISEATTLGELDAFKNVQGDVLVFKVNGIEISVNKRDDIETLLSKVTNSGADVRMTYDKYNDVFNLTSKKFGANSSFEISDVQGNLMNEIFGAKGGTGIGSDYLTTGDDITIGANFLSKINNMTAAQKKTLGEQLGNMTFQLTVNGETKTVRLDTMAINSKDLANGTYSAEDVYKAINRGIKSAFSDTSVEFSLGKDGKTKISSTTGEAFSISTTAAGDFAKLLGFSTSGTNFVAGNNITNYGYKGTVNSSAIDESLRSENGFLNVEKLNITADNPGVFEMTINGVTKKVSVVPGKDEDGKDIPVDNDTFLERLNAAVQQAFGSEATGVSFSATYDKMDGYAPTLDPEDFEKKADGYYSKETGKKLYDLPPEGVDPETNEAYPDGYYKNGKRVFDEEGYLLDSKGDKVANFYKLSGVKLTLNVAAGTSGAVEKSVSMSGSLADSMGFSSANNISVSDSAFTLGALKGGKDLEGTLTVNGKSVDYSSEDTLDSFLTKLNNALDDAGAAGIKDGKLFIKSEKGDLSVSDTGDMLKNIFGIKSTEKVMVEEDELDEFGEPTGNKILVDSGEVRTVYKTAAEDYTSKFATEDVLDEDGKPTGEKKAASTHSAAKNALLTIDGRDIENSSNTVSYNGVNITLKEVTTEKIEIGVQSDPEDVITRIKEWMDDYNALVYTLNSSLNEGKNRNYEPLTDEQKAEMTEDQIKTWETEAKKGLLRNDQTLRQILSDMRNALYEKVESAGISLYDIGIVTKSGLSDMNQAGQLEFDSNVTGGGEERLREMLTNNPDRVRMLFTDSENGIGAKLNKIISQAANTSSVDRGTLVRIAGTEILTGNNTSQLGNKIDTLDKYITSLKLRLETEHKRYWKQFSSLETSVQKMNTQSSWLQNQ